MALNLTHQTAAEFVARFRAKYKNASKEELARLAKWLYDKYTAGDITEAQIRTAFNLVADQDWLDFRDRVQALRNHWAAIQTAEGE